MDSQPLHILYEQRCRERVVNESYSVQMQLDGIPTASFTTVLDALLQEFTERFNDFKDCASTATCYYSSSGGDRECSPGPTNGIGGVEE